MLKESDVKSAAARDKRYLIADIDGLYLEVFPSGRKCWLLRMSSGGKRPKFVLGDWPAMSLRDARASCAIKRAEAGKVLSETSEAVVFGALLREWQRVSLADCTDKYKERIASLISARVMPKFEFRLAGSVTSVDVLNRIREIEAEGKYEVAHRVLSIFSRVFQFGVGKTLLSANPAASLEGLLMPRRVRHFARLTDPRDVGALMRAINAYSRPKVRNALLFSAYTFARPGEVCRAEWKEFALDGLMWRLPAAKMKMRKPHLVPLSSQVVSLLCKQKALLAEYYTSLPEFVFPSERGAGRPMSADTVRCALRSMGYEQEEMTAHGFRSMASTILNESGLWGADAIERQLAHSPLDRIRETYNYAQWMPERTKMMQWYADELDRLMK